MKGGKSGSKPTGLDVKGSGWSHKHQVITSDGLCYLFIENFLQKSHALWYVIK